MTSSSHSFFSSLSGKLIETWVILCPLGHWSISVDFSDLIICVRNFSSYIEPLMGQLRWSLFIGFNMLLCEKCSHITCLRAKFFKTFPTPHLSWAEIPHECLADLSFIILVCLPTRFTIKYQNSKHMSIEYMKLPNF